MSILISQMFEYKDEKAYTKGQEVLRKMIAGNKYFFDKINLKRTESRSINLMDFYRQNLSFIINLQYIPTLQQMKKYIQTIDI